MTQPSASQRGPSSPALSPGAKQVVDYIRSYDNAHPGHPASALTTIVAYVFRDDDQRAQVSRAAAVELEHKANNDAKGSST